MESSLCTCFQDAQSDFVRLPDDVLILILGQLDLISQLKMTHVHIRFLMLMPQVWRLQCKSMTLSLLELDISGKDLRLFLGSNQDNFQALWLKTITRINFNILTGYIFPNVHDFRFSTTSFRLKDSDIPRIIRAFPNLRTFSPYGNFTGQHMQDFPRLENLTLTYCSKFKVENLHHILETLQLKSLKLEKFGERHFKDTKLPLKGMQNLEVLECNTGEMTGCFLEHMKHLNKLKKLLLCGFIHWYVVRMVLDSCHQKNVKSVEVNASGADIFYLFHELPLQIQTLQVTNAIIPLNEMPNSRVYFENIKQIYLRYCVFNLQEDFDKLLTNSNTLEILGLDGCLFGFQDYTFSVREIVKHRDRALHLHLHQNMYLEYKDKKLPMQWNVEGEHSFFKLHDGTLNITYSGVPVAIIFE
ncbi:uncharacterized protein [Drosophila kikkawai]|uniref:F-box domain-containing protein n=1 Tax=Drosophila kikkawai TaxID=30033 RepID=A0ABM4GCH1_DROKI